MRTTLLSLILIHSISHAELDSATQKGLTETKSLLTNPSERQKVIDKDPRAKDVDSKVDALTGSSGTKNDLYQVSAAVMEKIVTETKGDPAKLNALIQEAQSNPEAFYKKYFDANDMQNVQNIAGKIERDKSRNLPGK